MRLTSLRLTRHHHHWTLHVWLTVLHGRAHTVSRRHLLSGEVLRHRWHLVVKRRHRHLLCTRRVLHGSIRSKMLLLQPRVESMTLLLWIELLLAMRRALHCLWVHVRRQLVRMRDLDIWIWSLHGRRALATCGCLHLREHADVCQPLVVLMNRPGWKGGVRLRKATVGRVLLLFCVVVIHFSHTLEWVVLGREGLRSFGLVLVEECRFGLGRTAAEGALRAGRRARRSESRGDWAKLERLGVHIEACGRLWAHHRLRRSARRASRWDPNIWWHALASEIVVVAYSLTERWARGLALCVRWDLARMQRQRSTDSSAA